MTLNAIKLKSVSKDFASLQVFEELSFEIQPNEFVGFLGPSGCGKSTLLSLISGLIPATNGEVINTFPKQSISYVFQEASLMPWQTVEKNIALPLEILHKNKDEIERDVLNKMKLFRLEAYKHFYPRQISGGMKMRTSLARALVSHPKLLLMDEPFSALDQLLREKCAEDVLEICQKDNLTTILVTHSIPEAVYLCDKIFILSPRPAKIIDTIYIDKNIHKQKNKDFRESEIFHSLCKQIRMKMELFKYD